MPEQKRPSLDEGLSRISDALATRPPPRPQAVRSEAATAMGVLAIVLIVAGITTGHPLLLALGMMLAAGGGALFVLPQAQRAWGLLQGGPPSSTHASIGMGAEIAEGAVLEPGASVEMGATVKRGAVVRAGAVVRMGASVAAEAVIERGAVVSWGADVGSGAVVGEKAVVGAGSTVRKGARVPPGLRISPGSTYAAGDSGAALPAAPPPAALKDPRDQRLAAVCDKLEAELAASPGQVRAFLGGSDRTIASLRRTCEDLSRRERAMRDEADPQSVARLDEERLALEQRLAEEKDPQLRQSLQGAAAAIDELKRQRELLKLGADRLEAEHTRLLYNMEGLASQFVRLRTAGAGTATPELEQSLLQLRAGIDAIADALEEVSRDAPAAMRELASAPAEGDVETPRSPTRTR